MAKRSKKQSPRFLKRPGIPSSPLTTASPTRSQKIQSRLKQKKFLLLVQQQSQSGRPIVHNGHTSWPAQADHRPPGEGLRPEGTVRYPAGIDDARGAPPPDASVDAELKREKNAPRRKLLTNRRRQLQEALQNAQTEETIVREMNKLRGRLRLLQKKLEDVRKAKSGMTR